MASLLDMQVEKGSFSWANFLHQKWLYQWFAVHAAVGTWKCPVDSGESTCLMMRLQNLMLMLSGNTGIKIKQVAEVGSVRGG